MARRRLAPIAEDLREWPLEMGNSPQMVFAHYTELVKPKDAEPY